MQLHGHSLKSRFHRTHRTDPATIQAANTACNRAHNALLGGRLISPGEALALACREARTKETLYSIAQAVAGETGCDLDDIESFLREHFPDLAK